MPATLRPFYQLELEAYRKQYATGNLYQAWNHLERAHVIGQAYPVEHSQVHGLMLIFGFKTKNIKETLGQIPRLLLGGIKSFAGKIPVGNTGGSNIPPLKPLPIQDDIKEIFRKAGVNR